jgi:hypothetical protein
MKRIVSHALALILLVTFGIALDSTANEAFAQIRPAYTKNVDEPGRLPYQNIVNFDSGSCISTSFCIVSFPAVPAGKRLVVEEITVLAGVASGGSPNLVAFGDDFATNVGNIYIVKNDFSVGPTIIGNTFFSMDRPVHVFYEPGATPKVKISVSTAFAFVCNMSLHGYLIDATN